MEAETTTPNCIVVIGEENEEEERENEGKQWAKEGEGKGKKGEGEMMKRNEKMEGGNEEELEEERMKEKHRRMMSPTRRSPLESAQMRPSSFASISSSSSSSYSTSSSSSCGQNLEANRMNVKKGKNLEGKSEEEKAAVKKTTTILVIENDGQNIDGSPKREEEGEKEKEMRPSNKIFVGELRRAMELEEEEEMEMEMMMNGRNGGGGGGGVRKSMDKMKKSADMKKRLEGQQPQRPTTLQMEWLEELRHSGAELETMTVLYAKSVLGNESMVAGQKGKEKMGNGGTNGWQGQQPAAADRVPICPHQPPPFKHRHSPPPFISHFYCPSTRENAAPAESSQFGRLRVTRIDKTQQNEEEENGRREWNNGGNGGGLFRSTVCLLAAPNGGGGDSTDCRHSKFPLAQSLVMNRSSRVEIDARKWPPPAAKSTAMGNGGTLNKFAQSLPNGRALAQRLAMGGGVDEWGEEEEWEGQERETQFGVGNAKIGGGEMAIYRPAIRYRRKCPATGNGRDRRKAGGNGLIGRSLLCQSNPNFPPFRHSIRVNFEANEGGEEDFGQSFPNDGRLKANNDPTHAPSIHSLHPAYSTAAFNFKFSPTFPSSFLPPPSSPPPLPPASSSDSGQGSAGTSPPFCPAKSTTTQIGQRRAAILRRENSSAASSSTEDSSLEFCDALEGPTMASRQCWAGANGFGCNLQPAMMTMVLPSFARTASTIDQALRLSSTIFAHFSSANPKKSSAAGICSKKLAETCGAFIRLVQASPCAQQMPKANIELVRRAIRDLEREKEARGNGNGMGKGEEEPNNGNGNGNDYLAVCGRQMAEGCMLQFCRVLCHYLCQCGPEDRLLPIALEQFVHLLLFGDEFCLEAIRQGAVDNLLALGQIWPNESANGIGCPSGTLKLILRALAVLCGTAKGCLQLLSTGGLDFVLHCLMDCNGIGTPHSHVHSPQTSPRPNDPMPPSLAIAFEAAGCLAQLSNPAHSFLRPPRPAGRLVQRLLQLADAASVPECLLLSMAALANLTAQSPGPLCEQLYVNNAVLRLIRAAQMSTRANAENPFVQEQLVTILTRMANRGHELALMAQGAIPALCKMLGPIKATGRHADLERRIGYKAAVCLGFLASSGAGLKALHEQKVYPILLEIGRPENKQRSMTPVQLICASIRQKLESTFHPQLETAV